MVCFNDIISLTLAAITAIPFSYALPITHTKRIAQTISESTADWEAACIAAGGAQQCNPLSQTAFTSLLAAGGNCDQQDAADAMIDLAKTLNNDSEMIRLTQLFVQQPRNAPDSLQVPYCQTAPKNAELDGLFHCQFAGSNFSQFSGDQTGNVPLGLQEVNPAGSCPAKTDGPVPDGVQLNTLVQDPGVGSASNGTGSTNGTTSGTDDTDSDDGDCSDDGEGTVASSAQTGATGVQTGATGVQTGATGVQTGATGVQTGATGVQTGTTAASGGATATTGSAAGTSTSTSSSSADFILQNGQDAIALNTQFASLTSSSTCTDGDQACIDGGFAQCVGGAFVVSQCAGGTQCFALPLVNKAGTSLACTTEADKDARIAATGAQ
ncbi:hypothetical protein BDZ89DRAFT_219438 [Hymenopellis radicata]|nr:hypothetical protein BDZ89DRAFT_219438 [Hymenopellis radicata]